MTRVVVQGAEFMMMVERMIQFVGNGPGADQQQHCRQQPGNESRFSLRCVNHEARQFAIPEKERQAALAYFSSSNTAVSSQLLYL